MKVLIQNIATSQFVKDERLEWTPLASEAMSFSSSLAAVDFFVQHQFPNAQLIMQFDEFGDGLDIHIPLLDLDHLFPTPAAAAAQGAFYQLQ